MWFFAFPAWIQVLTQAGCRCPDQWRRHEAEAGEAEEVRTSQGRLLRMSGFCRVIVPEISLVPLGRSVGLCSHR